MLIQGMSIDELESSSIFDEQKHLTEKMAFECSLEEKVKNKLADQDLCRILPPLARISVILPSLAICPRHSSSNLSKGKISDFRGEAIM